MGQRYETEPGVFRDVPDNVVPFARPRTLPLTERQEKLWRYIQSCERSPSYNEMAKAIGAKSNSRVASIIESLKAKGFVTCQKYRARTVVALDPGADLSNFTTAELAAEIARRLGR